MQSNNEIIDTYEEKVKIKLNQLRECQISKTLNSCLNCNDIYSCMIRKEYINEVYKSMNKGSNGGFEF
jgi:hypothetical protein